jgi:hypothetical protein
MTAGTAADLFIYPATFCINEPLLCHDPAALVLFGEKLLSAPLICGSRTMEYVPLVVVVPLVFVSTKPQTGNHLP